jgi:hypothetical protein
MRVAQLPEQKPTARCTRVTVGWRRITVGKRKRTTFPHMRPTVTRLNPLPGSDYGACSASRLGTTATDGAGRAAGSIARTTKVGLGPAVGS